jgi:hypothetical protein
MLQVSTSKIDSPPRCSDCGADLRPPPKTVTIDLFSWRPLTEIDAGAAEIREMVEKMKAPK